MKLLILKKAISKIIALEYKLKNVKIEGSTNADLNLWNFLIAFVDHYSDEFWICIYSYSTRNYFF